MKIMQTSQLLLKKHIRLKKMFNAFQMIANLHTNISQLFFQEDFFFNLKKIQC